MNEKIRLNREKKHLVNFNSVFSFENNDFKNGFSIKTTKILFITFFKQKIFYK